ncbi:hypothetical protein EZS27_000418 [termite gut metagenome]|uniref:Uroporphyrinogen decarboxylase (URO-D) domain-containing protein n=1 Tax=termite gut metagenome TaxID=433724 RepID=A0A5J4T189_9ZZZZ
METWKANFEESKLHYLDWWKQKGIVLTMWEHIEKEGAPYEEIPALPPAKDINQFWFDPEWRSDYLHYKMSRYSYKADILPVANTQLGPGSLGAILGADLEGREDTIWIRDKESFDGNIVFDKNNKWWKLHLDLLRACKEKAKGKYMIGCPDLVEGLDVLSSVKGSDNVMMDMMLDPENTLQQLRAINDAYFKVFNQIYDIINEDGEMAFCYFSIGGPGKVSKLQSDISIMISEDDFRTFSIPFLQEQCNKLDYTLYHLDGVDAIRHLDAVLELKNLNAVQWTPGVGQPQGGNACWYDLYKKILANGKSVMANWVTLDELEPLIKAVGNQGLNIQVDFKSEHEIDEALKIIGKYR